MPDLVEQMFSVRQVPWHKKYTGDATRVRDGYPESWSEARAEAGLGWEAVWVPTYEKMTGDDALTRMFGAILEAPGSTAEHAERLMQIYQASLKEDPRYGRIARDDTWTTLSYQDRGSYQLIPNADFGEMIDAIMKAGTHHGKPMVQLETGGCLDGGKQVWMLARINEPIVIPGDKSLSYPYLALTSRHDGKASCCARRTSVRIVCANTFSLSEAEGERTGMVFDFAHRGKDWRDKIEDARLALEFERAETAKWVQVMTALTGIKVSAAQEETWLRMFIPDAPPGVTANDERAARTVEEARDAIRLILAGPTVEGSGVRGSVYGIGQAAGEYRDHVVRAQTWETRTRRMVLKTDEVKARAIELAREVVGV